MAKKKTSAGGTKSAAIREVLEAHPKAGLAEIKKQLGAKGVTASDALINKLKYDRKRGGAAKSRRRKSSVSKADAIRQKYDEMGHDARPRDIIAALHSDGVKVTSAQVSMLRSKIASNGKSTARPRTAGTVPFEHLLAAKQLAERLGGVEKARQAVDSFAKLMGA